jgi:signal transduction histidine kinase
MSVRLRWSLRARTTAAATAVLLPLLAVAGVAGVWLQRNDLRAGVEVLAEEQARGLAEDVADGSTLPSSLGGEEDVVQVVSLDSGRVTASTPGADGKPLLPAPSGAAVEHVEVPGVVAGEPDRFLAVALVAKDGTSYVVVARSLESVDAATTSTTGILGIGGLFVLLAVGSLTWVLTGRALSPVERMRARAETISAQDLTSRLPVPDSDDEVARLAATLNDLLQRIEVATTTQRRFVADASHELRSPVATIRALVESDRISAHPGGHEGLSAEVLAETERLSRLVDDLLALARGDARLPLPQGPVDLSALLTTEAGRARRLPVKAAISDGLTVVGHADSLAVVVRNLLDNAEHHTADRITLAAFTDGKNVHVEVADNGPGVPEAERQRVFERFVRLDESRSHDDGGTGLGLAIVRQVVRDHGGDVTVEPATPGAGSPGARFIVTLPST